MRTLLFSIGLLGCLGLISLAGCDATSASGSDDVLGVTGAPTAFIRTTSGIMGRIIEGNIPGDAAAVCSNPIVVGDGNVYEGIKIDPPVRGVTAYADVTITATKMFLSWAAEDGIQVRHVVIKGGPDTHVYDYDGSLSSDARLHPPPHRQNNNCPDLSWYTICYTRQ